MTRKARPTVEELRAEYKKQGLTVNEVTKTVKGNRYIYARVWDRDRMQQTDIYIGPMKPKTLRGILTAEDVKALRKQFINAEATNHTKLADALDKVLELWRAEE